MPKTYCVLHISCKEVDGTTPITHEETGHQAGVTKAGKPGYKLRAITVKTAHQQRRGREVQKGTQQRRMERNRRLRGSEPNRKNAEKNVEETR